MRLTVISKLHNDLSCQRLRFFNFFTFAHKNVMITSNKERYADAYNIENL